MMLQLEVLNQRRLEAESIGDIRAKICFPPAAKCLHLGSHEQYLWQSAIPILYNMGD